ncbi:MAG: hypothetical protein IJQ56_11560, partial [Synergistaceae bacterium]|nr:hypothetical protein [Synergistaceae bacterium]
GRFENAIDYVVPVRGRRGFIVRRKGANGNITKVVYYFKWNNIWSVSGRLTGTGDLSVAAWGEPGNVLIASGGKLQLFSDELMPPTLTTLNNSPDNCRMVFVRNGRVGVVSGDDTIIFSHVGDCTQWDNNPEDESTGQFIEIGYKDGMNINAVVPLSRDLIIFKSPPNETDKGIIWRLTGEFPDWQVLEVAHNTGTYSMRSVQAVGNDIFYVTTAGLANLSSVTAYGEIKTSWVDRKVSSALTPLIDNTAKLWDVPFNARYQTPFLNELTIGFSDIDPPKRINPAEIDHEALNNLLAPNTNEHYHLTKAQYEKLIAIIGGYPPEIVKDQVIHVTASEAMTPYEIQGRNIKEE